MSGRNKSPGFSRTIASTQLKVPHLIIRGHASKVPIAGVVSRGAGFVLPIHYIPIMFMRWSQGRHVIVAELSLVDTALVHPAAHYSILGELKGALSHWMAIRSSSCGWIGGTYARHVRGRRVSRHQGRILRNLSLFHVVVIRIVTRRSMIASAHCSDGGLGYNYCL